MSRGLGVALAGVVLCDVMGVLLCAVPGIGWLSGATALVVGSPLVAWLALETHPERNALTCTIGLTHALVVILAAVVAIAVVIAALPLPDFSEVKFG